MIGTAAYGRLALVECLLGAALLLRLVLDLSKLHFAIAVCVIGFYAGFLVVSAANVAAILRGSAAPPLARSMRWALVLAVPVALLSSTLDCMGFDFGGCTPLCGAFTRFVAPAVALLVLLHGWTGARGFVVAAATVALALLWPNCICRNPVNRWWIDLLGRSPACYASAFAVFLLASTSLVGGKLVRPAILLAWGVVSAQLAFWIGHHDYHVTW